MLNKIPQSQQLDSEQDKHEEGLVTNCHNHRFRTVGKSMLLVPNLHSMFKYCQNTKLLY